MLKTRYFHFKILLTKAWPNCDAHRLTFSVRRISKNKRTVVQKCYIAATRSRRRRQIVTETELSVHGTSGGYRYLIAWLQHTIHGTHYPRVWRAVLTITRQGGRTRVSGLTPFCQPVALLPVSTAPPLTHQHHRVTICRTSPPHSLLLITSVTTHRYADLSVHGSSSSEMSLLACLRWRENHRVLHNTWDLGIVSKSLKGWISTLQK